MPTQEVKARAAQLEATIEHLGAVISAAEPWHESYSKDPKTHAKLIKKEAEMETAMRGYFRDLATDRITKVIDWFAYATLKAYDVRVTLNNDGFETEEGILATALHDPILYSITLGAQAGESTYEIPLGLSEASKSIQQAARTHTAQLVKGINATTKDRIQQSIKTSVELGEDQYAAMARVNNVINDASRAGTIARTEAVNAYITGGQTFATKAGAVSKTWQSISGACAICAPLDGVTVPMDSDYPGGDIGSGPPAHPNCRCGEAYNFDTGNPDDLPALYEE
jgi:hypothetical protein